MTNGPRYFAVASIFLLELAACQSSVTPTATALPAPTKLAFATATAPPATTSPSPSAPPSGSFENAALRADYDGQNYSLSLHLIDTTNGAPVAGYEAIKFGSVGTYAYLPGGTKLALIVYARPDNPASASLVVLDLPTWKASRLALPIDGWANLVTVGRDGSKLAVAFSSGTGDDLAVIDLRQMQVTATASVPNYVRGLCFTQDGSGLMVYASNEDPQTGLSLGDPQALLLKTADLSSLWQTDLPGVRDGFAPGKNFKGDPFSPGAGTRYTPALVFSPVGDLLYVAHADEDRLTRVDFDSRKVSGVVIHPRLGWLEQLLSLGAGVAYAKEQNGTEKSAAISPDGKELYMTGLKLELTQTDNGDWDLKREFLGLKVVDPANGEELLRLDTQEEQVSVLPDGRVLLRSWLNDQPSSEVFDPASRQIAQRYSGIYQDCVPLMRGGYVFAPVIIQDRKTLYDVEVYDPQTGKPVGTWQITNFNVDWLACSAP